MVDLEAVARGLLAREEEWNRRKSGVTGLSTGFPSLDFVTGGFQPGEVTILGGSTGHGKTSFCCQVVYSVITHYLEQEAETGVLPGRVLFFSPEMTASAVLHRMACQQTETPSRMLERGEATEEQRQRYREFLECLPGLADVLMLDAGRSLDIATVESVLNSLSGSSPPVKFVAIDYVQRLTAGTRNDTYARVSYISQRLKDLANAYDLSILALSQLNREVLRDNRFREEREREPDLADLRDSGRLAEDADNVWLLWRVPELEGVNQRDVPQIAALKIAKARNGPLGAVSFRYRASITRFEDMGLSAVRMDSGG